ncbi:CocE/NonD family hydrolase [uncultured Paludibaculum sp.]|uniref:CocE/NonD family hydrolase n=1 Tax=uncultured Paludibaculum sp. TaxID=1765020 RepID=UPI002AAB1072|nr:CocE/NonD family hydrolase [uncultured Paludibaculum sp.]
MRNFLCLLFASLTVLAQTPQNLRETYTKYEFKIPMRDGKRLHTAVYVPKDSARTYPFLMQRTPYSCSPYGIENYPQRLGPSEEFVKSGYIFVCQDVRGRYESEGTFVEMRPHGGALSESTDTYDTVDWLIKNVKGNNGKAGILGISYPGFYAAAAIPGAHPALVAASPQAPMIDLFRGDDSFHNGAFMLAANFGFYRFFYEHKQPQTPSAERNAGFQFGTPDHYAFYLGMGALANSNEKYFHFENPYWTANLKHTSYDEFWKSRSLEPHIHDTTPAILAVGGWFDAEDLQGPLRLFRAATAHQPKAPVTLVMGPWVHGGWARGDGSTLDPVRFDVKTGEFFREKIQFPFFEHFLKGKGEWKPPAAWVFATGSNEWHSYDVWPPQGSQKKTLYFQPGGKLGFEAPPEPAAFDSYISDPAKPVPFSSVVASGVPRTYMVDDQRHASARPDVLTYQTEPLEEAITIGGPLDVHLFASTSGTDSDWVVKLIDVYPADAPDPTPNPTNVRMGGYQQLLRGEPFRGRFYKSMEKPEALPANQFVKIEYVMPDVFHTFKRGHRIMVQVQSSWFPLVDRNPQKFVPNIPDARTEDFIKATQRIARQVGMASGLDVTVVR